MKVFLISCFLFSSYGCSQTEDEKRFDAEFDEFAKKITSTSHLYGIHSLDTTLKKVTFDFLIQRDGDSSAYRPRRRLLETPLERLRRIRGSTFIQTADNLTISHTWRFISALERADGGVRIKVEYTMDFLNPTDYDVEFRLAYFTFRDKDAIPIHEDMWDVGLEVSKKSALVEANGTAPRIAGTFEIELDNIDSANQITAMIIWGGAYRME